MKKKFLYFLTNASGLSYYVDNGVVLTSAIPKPLEYAPDGWKDQVVNFTRNSTYFGVFRSFSIPLRFVKDGAFILRTRLWNEGIEDSISLIILRLNDATGQHELFYKGEIDLSKAQDSLQYFDVNVAEGGLIKFIKAFESTTFEIPVFGTNAIDVVMHGLELYRKYRYSIVDANASILSQNDNTVGCVYVSDQGTSFNILTGGTGLQGVTAEIVAAGEERWLFKNIGSSSVTFTISGKIDFEVRDNAQHFNMFFQKNTLVKYFIVADGTDLYPGNYSYPVNMDITLSAGESLYLNFHSEYIGSAAIDISFNQTELFFEIKTQYKETTIKALPVAYVGNQLIKKIAGEQYSLSSTLLETSGLYMTCGDAVRGLEGAKIKTTWKEFFNSMNRNLNAAFTIEGKVGYLVKKKDCFDTTVVYDLGEVKDAKFSLNETMLVNSLKIGYPNQTYDDVNGRDEFNNTSEFKTSITRIQNVLDLTAQYRADPYGIEFTRINLEGKTTTDNSSDNSVFLLDIVQEGATFVLNRPVGMVITGVSNPNTIFNVRLSPKNLLNKHGDWIRGLLYKQEDQNLTFQTTEKNANLKTVLAGETVEEKADVLIGSLASPYITPFKVDCEVMVPESLFSIMASNSKATFIFTYNGIQLKGWPYKASQKPSGNQSQEWSLQLAYDNDLTQLIHE